MATDATTKASQPTIAVLGWRALQRPMRAATFALCWEAAPCLLIEAGRALPASASRTVPQPRNRAYPE